MDTLFVESGGSWVDITPRDPGFTQERGLLLVDSFGENQRERYAHH